MILSDAKVRVDVQVDVFALACPLIASIVLPTARGAWLAGAFLTVFLFQVAAYLYIGHVEAAWPLIVGVTTFLALITSAIVVTCARLYRFRRSSNS